jgi:predicted Fe-Mo cluster-binding NifX family protein
MKAAIPTNDGILMAGSFEQAKGFLIFDIKVGQIVKEELVWNKTAYVPDSPEAFINPISGCSATFANTISDNLRSVILKNGIDLISSKDDIITNVILHYLENEVKQEANYCCCP